MTLVKLDRRGDRTIVTLDRPESLNALSPAMLAEMRTAVESVAASDARVLIIQGEGRAFSAGADLKAVRDPAFTRDQAKQFSEDARAVTHLMETMSQVVIARVHGFCFTGAFEIMLAADFIL
ncbi:MAG: enoyl-CoA hydratase/carnithine racemase, partial [Brevundimonas sp.]|nr:enoyl-CoA hydratase/carnithine racemase [Brevundimonas sp.]